MSDTPPKAPATPRADARCPHCDHVFETAEVIDEWCASCGKKIPEVILKDVRPKRHLRNPLPLPEATKADQAEQSRETKVRVAGLIVMLVAIICGLVALAWGAVNQVNSGEGGAAWWIGGAAVVMFIGGLVMFNRGETGEE